ncbi:MAG: pantoate--beta-alanine ligase [Spirochaetes bacterium]|nr:pantoate--beta-alanine ligase [Spirochaetota bacterium]
MKIVHSIDEVRAEIRKSKIAGKRIGLVPTMGYLHKGHISLVSIAKENSDFIVMSIFVNKLQFNDINDFNKYPKDIEQDIIAADSGGVDLLFIPDDSEMYQNNLTTVNVGILTGNLCGAHRPGHFEGVFTVVSKLFNIVQPDVAVFGQKDIQQAVTIEKMVYDLNFPIHIIIAPIVRESSGLAMSSRNKHLSEKHRSDALVLNKSLNECKKMIDSGYVDVKDITNTMQSIIESGSPDKIDYISIVGYSDLSHINTIEEKSIVAVAAFWGSTRLIDNMIIDKDDSGFLCIY